MVQSLSALHLISIISRNIRSKNIASISSTLTPLPGIFFPFSPSLCFILSCLIARVAPCVSLAQIHVCQASSTTYCQLSFSSSVTHHSSNPTNHAYHHIKSIEAASTNNQPLRCGAHYNMLQIMTIVQALLNFLHNSMGFMQYRNGIEEIVSLFSDFKSILAIQKKMWSLCFVKLA